MILTEDITKNPLISHYSPESIQIQEAIYENTLLITPSGEVATCPVRSLEEITEALSQKLIALQPEVILIGTGVHHQLPESSFIAYFTRHHMGIEIMSTAAACRTYNVLALENRRVAAILIL